jgi:Fic family protein
MRNTLQVRKKLLEELGGLPQPRVQNKEWLYILGEETRNSISIEGYFISEKELEDVLIKRKTETRDEKVAFNYFRTALFLYGLAYENYKTGELTFNEALIRQTNKGITDGEGDYRKGDIVITGAKLIPPSGFYIRDWVRLYINWTVENLDKLDIVQLVSKQHVLFESIHPFDDGNGRTGRVLLNYLLISKGFTPVIIKGDDVGRKEYIKALEEAEEPLREILRSKPQRRKLEEAMDKMNSRRLEALIKDALIRSMDRVLITMLEKKLGLKTKPSYEVARGLGYSPDSIRELIRRGYFIAVKRGRGWSTHPSLDVRKITSLEDVKKEGNN